MTHRLPALLCRVGSTGLLSIAKWWTRKSERAAQSFPSSIRISTTAAIRSFLFSTNFSVTTTRMITVIFCSVLFYALGLVAPTLGALHSCLKHKAMPQEKTMLLWIQYFLLFSTLVTVVFPYVVAPVCFLLPSWLLALLKATLVTALVIPKFGLVPKFFGWLLAHYVDYLAVMADTVQKHVVTPLKTHVTHAIDRVQATSDGGHASRKEL